MRIHFVKMAPTQHIVSFMYLEICICLKNDYMKILQLFCASENPTKPVQ